METAHPALPHEAVQREKNLVALSSVLAAIALTTFKIIVGAGTGSMGILSEAAHSGLDLVAAAVTFFAVRASGRPADRGHAYGHGKVENLSALFETTLLLVTCAWIVWESVDRLLFHDVQVEIGAWSFVVMAVSIVVDFSRSRALARAARKYQSQALEADALHFSTDIWSSSVVIVGLVGVALSTRLAIPWLMKADAVAALGVAAITVWVSLQLGKKSVNDLLDGAPPELVEQVASAARVPGVGAVRQVRLRRSGGEVFADLTVEVARGASFERAHDVANEVERAVRTAVGQADVVVHVEPAPAAGEGFLTLVRLAAARHGLGAHAIRLHRAAGAQALDVHLEVSDALTMGDVDGLVERFEREVRAGVPELGAIHLHTEPVADAANVGAAEEADAAERALVREVLASLPGAPRAEDLEVLRVENGLHVSFRWAVGADVPALAAREQALAAERQLRERIPRIVRVLVRLEAKKG
jgi:cation diffusion facilitator family transporter